MAQEKMQYCGINHVALVARDMAETVDFYQNVLEMPLVKTVDYPNNHGQHFFFDCGGGRTIAFFWWPGHTQYAPGVASMHMDHRKDGAVTAHGSMNHLAITVPLEKFDRYVERMKEKGIPCYVINHGTKVPAAAVPDEDTFVRSLYFKDPNGVHMEFAAYTREFTAEDVVDDPVDASGVRIPLKKPALAAE